MAEPAQIYRRVLVPLDGSGSAEFAIDFAIDLATRHNADLILLYLAYPPVQAGEDQDADASEVQAHEHVLAHLDDLRDTLRALGLRVHNHTLETRDLAEALLSFMDTERISIVVMSTQGRTDMIRWIFGSEVGQALSNMPVPILLVRPVYHHIIVPMDGSKWAESAIPRAVEIARQHDAELVLLHVYQSPVSDYAGQLALAGQKHIADQNFEQIREQLVSLRNRLRREGLQVREQIIRSTNPVQAICEYVEAEEGINMVVMSTHGRTGLSRWLVGSVAQRVLKGVRCPVVLVQPDRS